MHTISGLIAEATVAKQFASRHGLAAPTTLSLGFSFLPLDNKNLDRVVGSNGGVLVEGFEHLTPELITVLCQASRSGDFAYIETYYWGGDGRQGAAVFQAGVITFGPKTAEIGVISEALEMLGIVSADLPDDAFERVGLGRYRSNETIRAAAQQPPKPSEPRSEHQRGPRIVWWLLAIITVAAAAVVAANAGLDFTLPVPR